MNLTSRFMFRLALVLTAGLSLATTRADEGGDTVQSPTIRRQAADAAKHFLGNKQLRPVAADPFHSEAFAQLVSGGEKPVATVTTTENQVGPRTDRDLLQAIAASLKPSGFFVIGGPPTLVFGQKRVKSGSFLTITFEGTEYTLEIVSVDRTNFTLRLNREEFTRPLK